MTMPTDIGIIDLMLDIPTGDEQDWYEFLKPQLREESKDYEFPAQYMFKDVPHLEVGDDPVEAAARADGPLRHREGDDRRRLRRGPARQRHGARSRATPTASSARSASTPTGAWTASATW